MTLVRRLTRGEVHAVRRRFRSRALVMLTLRRVLTPDGDGFRIDRSQDPLLRYYASSIAHFLE